MKQQGEKYKNPSRENEIQKRPRVVLSDLYLDLCVEAGKTFNGSFTVYSGNGEELSGKVITTNDKMIMERKELSGMQCEIPFYFKGKLAWAGEEHFGDFLLLTNGGEYNLPYCITVTKKKFWLDGTAYGTLEEFADFAKKDWKRAKEAFFSKEFKEVFILDNEEYQTLYQGLLKGRNKDIILDNFLQETVGKPPVRFRAHWEGKEEKGRLGLEKGNDKTFLLEMDGWGYAQGSIGSRDGKLTTDRDFFTSWDFQDGSLLVCAAFEEGQGGWDTLVIQTMFETIEIPVTERFLARGADASHVKKDPEERAGQKLAADICRTYVGLRTGELPLDRYVAKSLALIGEAEKKGANALFLELLTFQIRIVENQDRKRQREDGRELLEYFSEEEFTAFAMEVEKKKDAFLQDSLCRNYYFYLMALYKRRRAALLEAVVQIRDSYEKSQSFYDFWLLLHVDRDYALDHKLQCQKLSSYRQQGVDSPLLYIALLDVLNHNPYYLEDLGGSGTALIQWGLRHGYLSLDLSRHFARLTMKEKFYQKNLLNLLMKLYNLKRDEAYLMAICSMLIKGNKVRREYHGYFEQALAMDLKIVGINEYYLRSLDFNSYPILPKPLLMYFNYSNSLDAREKAYLYTNILHYEKQYDYIYRNYLERMEQFVKEQMMEGRMNRYLKHLYEYFLPSLLKNENMVKYLPNIIFKKKLTVKSPAAAGVYVCHGESEEEIYVPIVEGVCQVETYSDHVSFYFADTKGNRYRAGIPYQLSRYLNENKYMELCLATNLDNKKVLLKWTKALEGDGPGNEKIAAMILETSGIKGWIREKAVEQILDYHYGERSFEELDECLGQINYRSISPSYRRTLMNYYMACNRVEDAYFGIELYGSDLVDPEQLYLLTCVGLYLHKEEKDELLLIMAHRTFINGRYNDEILLYLRMHLEARVFDLLTLWGVLKEKGMDTPEYEKKILDQMLFTGEDDERMLDVLLSYISKEPDDALASSLLDRYSAGYFLEGKKMPESFFEILDGQAKVPGSLSFMSRLAYLGQKAGVENWEEEKEQIREYLDELRSQAAIFPFFEAYRGFYELPPLFQEMTWLIFTGDEAEKELILTIAGKKGQVRQEAVPLCWLCAGLAHGGVYLLENESIQEVKGTGRIKEGDITVFCFGGALEGSRNKILSRLENGGEDGGAVLARYESVMSQMQEQLTILTEEQL